MVTLAATLLLTDGDDRLFGNLDKDGDGVIINLLEPDTRTELEPNWNRNENPDPNRGQHM